MVFLVVSFILALPQISYIPLPILLDFIILIILGEKYKSVLCAGHAFYLPELIPVLISVRG
jgi:hypothetical protein